ncbi:benzoate/H(+) symporter BenE family transporter [Cryptosporangium arvum]|uniref:Benzoate transporter n=1 Tax=Cryptosporangium arvum DSM 44712 TaxID=927661 RepID=A0A010ZNX9_9ACTN|nr:benzoate/H(+) symporter BenE family transporter [Cryptosporangium arvum]EXG80394.1 benzoate transporter [Cryptosporangium arvum DSM 44712]
MLQPVLAGVVTALVGFASSFAVVIAGLRAVGADPAEASSGLLALCVATGVTAVWLSVRYRTPMTIAWSTPGAALLVSTGAVDGGFPAAVGAFLVAALLVVAAGLFGPLARWIAAIPAPVASAMLAGVLLDLCLSPVRAVVETPLLALPVIVVWALLTRFARAWAVPAALVVAAAGVAITRFDEGLDATLRPTVALTAPTFELGAVVSIALPLFLVTMAAQNVPGMAVMASYGYRPPLRPALVTTGLGSAIAAPFGGHAINLAAISAALAAGPDAHPDPERRWIASVSAGVGMTLLGLGAGLATALVVLAPPVLIEAVAGLALLAALGAALTAALTSADSLSGGREAAVVTFVVTASGVTLAGVGAAFWGLLAGGAILLLFRRRSDRPVDVEVLGADEATDRAQ